MICTRYDGCNFSIHQENGTLKQTKSVVFAGGKTDVPDKCGKSGELCETFDKRERLIIVVCSAVFSNILIIILSGTLVW